jgi:hypothetical protein
VTVFHCFQWICRRQRRSLRADRETGLPDPRAGNRPFFSPGDRLRSESDPDLPAVNRICRDNGITDRLTELGPRETKEDSHERWYLSRYELLLSQEWLADQSFHNLGVQVVDQLELPQQIKPSPPPLDLYDRVIYAG